MTGKQRMLAAYRGAFPDDRVAVAPEFWYYYPARLLGVDMIEFARDVPFHEALQKTFAAFGCEGWGVAFGGAPAPETSCRSEDVWLDEETLETRTRTRTPHGELTSRRRISRTEPAWTVERPVKDWARDRAAWEHATFGGAPERMDVSPFVKAWTAVGESYLLEGWLGLPFFDTVAGALEGGLERAVFLFLEEEEELERLRERYLDHLCRRVRVLCDQTPLESFAIGCSWSCNSLLGPRLWRRWDRPALRAVAEEVHRHGRLLHLHLHGRCRETLADLAAIGADCVCPFERPPGGDIDGRRGLAEAAETLAGAVTVNGNVHTVETLIRGTPADVRREVGEILAAFAGNPRVIVGTGDQVGRETPEENLHALVEEATRLSPAWRGG
jgi:hypothetical protein